MAARLDTHELMQLSLLKKFLMYDLIPNSKYLVKLMFSEVRAWGLR